MNFKKIAIERVWRWEEEKKKWSEIKNTYMCNVHMWCALGFLCNQLAKRGNEEAASEKENVIGTYIYTHTALEYNTYIQYVIHTFIFG